MKLFLAATLAALTAAAPAFAGVNYQTATAGPGPTGVYAVQGDGTDANSNFIGAAFSVTGAPVSVLQVGANFDQFGTGQIFVAIVPLSTFNSLPTVSGANLVASLQASVLGWALLTAPSSAGDASVQIKAALPDGDYAAIFGSGLFGATGTANLTDQNTTVGSPNVFTSLFSDSYGSFGYDSQIRIFEVPEPASFALLGLGGVAVSTLRRRRAA